MKAAIQTSGHALADRKDDLYETPRAATRALLDVQGFPGAVWEPACGRGAISNVLALAGHVVYSTDLVNYGFGGSGVDFLMERRVPSVSVRSIVTNPPFKLATEFVRHALDVIEIPSLAILARLAFLESAERSDILERRLARVYIFRNRLPMMHRDGWQGKKSTSAVPFAWFVWDQNHVGPAVIHRITALADPAPVVVASTPSA